ncbi:MAG: DEAD/DEAH box helicase [Gemmatales bacterium]|nr:DEAD/DEAH box helicase [Gemmatales bacterium]MDW8222073.1 DEAD/DEAH box helicase [Gemmatales bacterium]
MQPDIARRRALRWCFADALVGSSSLPEMPQQRASVAVVTLDLDIPAESRQLELVIRSVPAFAPRLNLSFTYRTRAVRFQSGDVAIRSCYFPAAEAGGMRPVRPPGPQESVATEELSQIYLGPRSRLRYPLPRDILRTQDRLLLLLQPPAPTIFRQQRLPLPAKPFPYQWQGIAFLLPRHAALLADEMGLGKTIQAILTLRLLFHLGEVQHALIVCPKSLVPNWARELQMWAGEIPFEVITGEAVLRRHFWDSAVPVKLTNYETVARDLEYLLAADRAFDLVIADEAQRIKNGESKTAQALCSIRRTRSWALTGTPVENSLSDLESIFRFLRPGTVRAGMSLPDIRAILQDYLLRRTKEQVAPDLPPKLYRDILLELTPQQAVSYHRARQEGVVWLRKLGRQVTVKHMLALLQRLKQICNFDPQTGESAKLKQLEADLQEVSANGRKAIVFSQWVETLQVLAQTFHAMKPVLFHGQMSASQRLASLRQFREDPGCHLLLMTYSSGGVGLNLQCANYVFLFDRWWNPALEEQAVNRAHRLGQTQPVVITRYLVVDTIESRIQEILEQKRSLYQQVMASGVPLHSVGWSLDELWQLFEIPPPHGPGT